MAEAKKWSVTYTKHIKQKRKVYQDGVLELHPSRKKVILYDDCERVLESRFVKKEDNFTPGETLSFESCLVDIGNLLRDDHKPDDLKIGRTSQLFLSPKFEFKKGEITKYGSSPGCPCTDLTKSSQTGLVHNSCYSKVQEDDGYLQLHSCGSKREQVVVYDETRRLLESRFLKRHEIISSGESIAFDGHLVDIGECKDDHKPPVLFKDKVTKYEMVGKTKSAGSWIHFNNQVPVGECQKEVVPSKHIDASFRNSAESNVSAPGVCEKPVRAAHEILSILQKTKNDTDVATAKSSSKDDQFLASQSSGLFQKKEHLQDSCDKGSTIVELDEEYTRSEISKFEAVKQVHLVVTSESKKTGFATTSGSFVGSGASNIWQQKADLHYSMSGTCEDASGFDPQSLASIKLDLKPNTTSVLPDSLTGGLQSRNCTDLLPFKDDPTVGISAAESVEIVCQPRVDSKEINGRWQNGGPVIGMAALSDDARHEVSDSQVFSKWDLRTMKTDDFPSFDLGF